SRPAVERTCRDAPRTRCCRPATGGAYPTGGPRPAATQRCRRLRAQLRTDPTAESPTRQSARLAVPPWMDALHRRADARGSVETARTVVAVAPTTSARLPKRQSARSPRARTQTRRIASSSGLAWLVRGRRRDITCPRSHLEPRVSRCIHADVHVP